MRRTAATLPVIASALLLAACSSPATTASPPPASPAASQASSPAAPASAAGSAAATQSAAPTSLDPCQLVTSSEASALAGTTSGRGRRKPAARAGSAACTDPRPPTCSWSRSGRPRVPPPRTRTGRRSRPQAQALINKKLPAGISLSAHTQKISGLGDRAALASGSASAAGQTIDLSGIYLLKGATFLAFQDVLLGHPAPGAAAMEAEPRRPWPGSRHQASLSDALAACS